tara:strand:+ start:684 stop:1367 length:684 start_codon:yes stop_codon:yes gene_type:complete
MYGQPIIFKENIKHTDVVAEPSLPDHQTELVFSDFCKEKNIYLLELKPPDVIRKEMQQVNHDLINYVMAMEQINVIAIFGNKERYDLYNDFFQSVTHESRYPISYELLSPHELKNKEFEFRYSHVLWDKETEKTAMDMLKKAIFHSNMACFVEPRYTDPYSLNLSKSTGFLTDLWFYRIFSDYSQFSQYYFFLDFLQRPYSLHQDPNINDVLYDSTLTIQNLMGAKL